MPCTARGVLAASLLFAGCFDPTDADADGGGSESTDGTGTSSPSDHDDDDDTVDGADDSSDDAPDTTSADCDTTAAPKDAACLVDDAYGIFVAPGGLDLDDGTRENPVQTLARAAQLAAERDLVHVFACAAAFAETDLVVPAGVSVHGGFDCANGWEFSGLPTVVEGSGIALTVSGAGSTVLEDLEITATADVRSGGTAIAVLVAIAEVEIRDASLVALAAAPGDDAPQRVPAATDGPPGADGLPLQCAAELADVDLPVATANPDCPTSIGGAGGQGGTDAVSGSAGADGSPAPQGGDGGVPDQGAAPCTSGTDGSSGADGVIGAAALGLGVLGADGWHAPEATLGSDGSPGGGGGGGGGSGTTTPCITNVVVNQSGGGGGAGGCGGEGGTPAVSGGSSLALASVDATVTLARTIVQAGDGGDAGLPGPGAAGGLGGPGGPTSGGANNPACGGGDGGAGGHGGAGGGGAGGHSVAVAHAGPAPTIDADVDLQFGTAGLGSDGGDDGVAASMLAF